MDSFLDVQYVPNFLSQEDSPAVKDERISITFRNVKTTGVEKHQSEENLPRVKRQCINNQLEERALDTFFSTLSPSLLEDRQETISLPKEPASESIFKKCIGSNVFLSAELYKGQLKVHIRLYNENSNGSLYPTKTGVTMDLSTWYDFYLKLFNFNFCYTTSSYVANNCILVLNENEDMRVQTLNIDNFSNCTFIKLDKFQKDTLTECVPEFNDCVIEYLFTKRLPYFIECERRSLAILSSEEEDNLKAKLIICLENELSCVFQSVFSCNGCIIEHPSQRQHDCLMKSNLEKYNLLKYKVLLLINMEKVASNFVNSVDFISENFVKNISVNYIKDVLFESM